MTSRSSAAAGQVPVHWRLLAGPGETVRERHWGWIYPLALRRKPGVGSKLCFFLMLVNMPTLP